MYLKFRNQILLVPATKQTFGLFSKFEIFLKEADARYSEIYIVGDLNCNILSDPPEVHTTHLLDLMFAYQLAQLIKNHTGVNAKAQNLIDVFITNKDDNISNSEVYMLH